jgi:hypothetical protein
LFFSFINHYGKDSPDMIKHVRQAIQSSKHYAITIRHMATKTEKYCQDQHVFEFMFEPYQLVRCERIIRHAIGKANSMHYQQYDMLISVPFTKFLFRKWEQIDKVLADLKINDVKPDQPNPQILGQVMLDDTLLQ